jgi:hypothetical protein
MEQVSFLINSSSEYILKRCFVIHGVFILNNSLIVFYFAQIVSSPIITSTVTVLSIIRLSFHLFIKLNPLLFIFFKIK